MITLYYHRGACSTSNHFALEEAGIEYEAIEVDLKKRDDPLVQKVRALNPMAQTPVLVLDDGHVLTQNAATLPFIADPRARQGTSAAARHVCACTGGKLDSVRRLRSASDHHRYAYAGLPDTDADKARARQFYEDRSGRRLKILEDRLASDVFILGDRYSVIDGYTLIVLNWSEPAKLSLEAYSNIRAYMARIASSLP